MFCKTFTYVLFVLLFSRLQRWQSVPLCKRRSRNQWSLCKVVSCIQCTDTGPTSSSTDPTKASAMVATWLPIFKIHWYESTKKRIPVESENGTPVCCSRGGRLNHWTNEAVQTHLLRVRDVRSLSHWTKPWQRCPVTLPLNQTMSEMSGHSPTEPNHVRDVRSLSHWTMSEMSGHSHTEPCQRCPVTLTQNHVRDVQSLSHWTMSEMSSHSPTEPNHVRDVQSLSHWTKPCQRCPVTLTQSHVRDVRSLSHRAMSEMSGHCPTEPCPRCPVTVPQSHVRDVRSLSHRAMSEMSGHCPTEPCPRCPDTLTRFQTSPHGPVVKCLFVERLARDWPPLYRRGFLQVQSY